MCIRARRQKYRCVRVRLPLLATARYIAFVANLVAARPCRAGFPAKDASVLPNENVQNYPRPPEVQPVPSSVRATFAGVPILDTKAALRVLETHHAPTYYIPPADVLVAALVPTPHETICEWKGRAIYYDLVLNGRRVRNAAWSYPAPKPRFEVLRNHLAFYATALGEAWVGDSRVLPQPGDFYGGWVTRNLSGRIKGAMGTMHR